LLALVLFGSLASADEPPSFGSDVSVSYGLGALLGAWPDAGVHGFFQGRFDAFTQDRDQSGPRLGASIWASVVVAPQQYATEETAEGVDRFKFKYSEYGVLAVLRDDPAAQVGYAFGFGFGRIDLTNYYGGPHALPTATFEFGPRFATKSAAFVDVLGRAQWATALGPSGDLDEWWGASLQVAVGAHAR
jgi:hypothetical protein